jgi:hypothetical protein
MSVVDRGEAARRSPPRRAIKSSRVARVGRQSKLADQCEVNEMSSSVQGQVLAPVAERLQDGRGESDGRRHQVHVTRTSSIRHRGVPPRSGLASTGATTSVDVWRRSRIRDALNGLGQAPRSRAHGAPFAGARTALKLKLVRCFLSCFRHWMFCESLVNCDGRNVGNCSSALRVIAVSRIYTG